MNNFGNLETITFFTQVTKDLYEEVIREGRVYPKRGISCRASNDGALNLVSNKLGYDFFFGWELNEDKLINFKGYTFKKTKEKTDYILLKVTMDKQNTVLTHYYNYADLIFLSSMLREDRDYSNPNFLFDVELEFGISDIPQFVEQVFVVEDSELIQVLYKYLDKNSIEFVSYIEELII